MTPQIQHENALVHLFGSVWQSSTHVYPQLMPTYDALTHLGRTGLTATLFLIGTGLSRRTLQQVRFRPFVQALYCG